MGGIAGTAVVIGGTGGIGAACGHALARAGWDVTLVARDAQRLAAAARQIPGARFVAADCGSEADVSRLFAETGPVSVLVHAAGVRLGAPVAEAPTSVLDELYSAHVRSVFLVAKGALLSMPDGGRVILTSSIAARRPVAGLAGYGAMKAGTEAFAKSLALELAERNIGVYVVVPSRVDTPMLVKRWHCLQPADVAAAVTFLAGVGDGLRIGAFELRSVIRGPNAPPLSGPVDGVVGTP